MRVEFGEESGDAFSESLRGTDVGSEGLTLKLPRLIKLPVLNL